MENSTQPTKKSVKLEKQYSFSPVNRRPRRTEFKKFEPSMIVPDRNMDISVIMKKYAGGQHRGLEPLYTAPEMMEFTQGIDARKLSITELHQRIDENKEKIRRFQRNLQEQEKTRLAKLATDAQQKLRDDLTAQIQKELQEGPKKH